MLNCFSKWKRISYRIGNVSIFNKTVEKIIDMTLNEKLLPMSNRKYLSISGCLANIGVVQYKVIVTKMSTTLFGMKKRKISFTEM